MKLTKSNIPFTMVANEVLKDPNLSFKAKGIYAYLFSKPDEWDFAAKRMTMESADGREAIMSGLQELEGRGYLKRSRQSDGKVDYLLTFSEKSQSRETLLRLPDPKSGNPTVAKPHSGKTRLISNIDNTSNKEKESNKDCEVENSTSQDTHSLSGEDKDTSEITSSDIDSFGNPITKKPEKIKKPRVSDERVIKIITEWNKYPVASVLSMGKVPNKTSEKELLPLAISNFSLDKRIKDRLRFFPDISQWEKAIKKYVEDIINRQPTNDYAQHRFSLYDFVNQDNGFVKFVNK